MSRTVEWVYAIGSSWNQCDPATQQEIERLWANDAAGWIKSLSFGDYVYVDTTQLSLTYAHHYDIYLPGQGLFHREPL